MTLGSAWFDAFYAANGPDPWGFADRWYERRKRAVTLAALPRRRFGRALELGCSVGVLTEELAGRCDDLLATDLSDAAVTAARQRLAGRPGVRVERSPDPRSVPAGPFDLVVASEVLYYLDAAGRAAVTAALVAGLAPDGVLLACHWRHAVEDYPADGDTVHAELAGLPGVTRLVHHLEEDFVLDVLARDGRSVARREGLVGG